MTITTSQYEQQAEEEDEPMWSELADADELERLVRLHPGAVYLTIEDDPRYIMGYIEAITDFDETLVPVRDQRGRFTGESAPRRVLTLTDPVGVRILEPDEPILVGVAGGHHGHGSRFSGAWYCDTCDSPLCDLA